MDLVAGTSFALAWAVWRSSSPEQPAFSQRLDQIGLRRPQQLQRHAKLAASLRGADRIVPPLAEIDEGIANPTRTVLVFSGAAERDGAVTLLELALPADATRDHQHEALQLLHEAAQTIASQARARKLADLQQRDGLWRRLDDFAKQVHQNLDLDLAAHTIANETARLLKCDRATVVLRRGARWIPSAVSGVDFVDRRSPSVLRLADLCAGVGATNSPLWSDGRGEDLEPQLEQLLGDYLDVSAAKYIGVVPISAPLSPETAAEDVARKPTSTPPLGAIVVEAFESPGDEAQRLRAGVEALLDHIALALGSAVACARIPGFAWLRRLTSSDWVERARSWSRLKIAAGVAAVALAVLIMVPAPSAVWCEGRLAPQVARVFAPQNCVVEQVHVRHGDHVDAGTLLVTLRSDDLIDAVNRISGELATNEEDLRMQQSRRRGDNLSAREEDAAIARIRELEVKQAALRESLAIRQRELEALQIHSPVAGRVITWGVHDRLHNRPLQRGQRLLEIADEAGEWTTELQINERRLAEVQRVFRSGERPVAVDLALANDHRRRVMGRLVALDSRAESPPGESGGTVAARVEFDEPPPEDLLRADVGVAGRIRCGWRPLGYVLLGRVVSAARGFLFRI